ncbi:IclR family transcriptional regulator [Arthrobacter halodurans]|uniref:IclR family transcriptional regulator n=1 Tax=Arthrobacter halodurans TaxID=516699 RepID=A0ABV4UK17_9MICC
MTDAQNDDDAAPSSDAPAPGDPAREKAAKGPDGLRAVDRTVTLLLALSRHPEGVSLADLAREAGITLTTAHRILATLRKSGLVRETPSGRQALGVTSLILANAFLDGVDVRSEARPHLTALRDDTNETCHLGVLASSQIVYIDKLDSRQRVRMFSSIGGTGPALTTAIGRAILAHSSGELVERTVQAAAHEHDGSPDLATVLAESERVRGEGYSTDLEENEPGICCVGAPVFDHAGRVIAGLSLSTPTSRFDRAGLADLGRKVRATADAISRAMGYPTPETR